MTIDASPDVPLADEFYVISVAHTQREDLYVTIWRPDDRGYCWALSRAGRYSKECVLAHLDYYNSGGNLAVPCRVLDALAIAPKPGHHDNDAGPVIANIRANWKILLANVIAPTKYPAAPEFPGAKRVRED